MLNKQQEYLKQREKLRCVTQGHVAQKVLDPDIMIEQLIADEKTFRFTTEAQSSYALPKWLKTQNNLVPALYDQVWQAVKLRPTNQFCDTRLITQFFTTSGLSLEKLGHLWSLTNVCSPGALTQQELYVMLTLIALVQAGYHVKDMAIIKGINHPILPQLDYNFLNISVSNPAINRSASKPVESRQTKIITFNGFDLSTDVNPPQVKSSNSQDATEGLVNIFFDKVSEPLYKSDSNVAFFMPERRMKSNVIDPLNCDSITELNVDFSEIKSVERKNEKNFDFLNPHNFSSEPKSLDLPNFSVDITSKEDDEFTEFQSAPIAISSIEEYTDYQSASPIVKYEFDNFSSNMKFDVNSAEKPSQLETMGENDTRIYKTTHEADKYDVFRSLIEQNDGKTDFEEVNEKDDYADEDEEEEGNEEFEVISCPAPSTESSEKPKMCIKEKCLTACLQLLQEGLTVFSNISSEQTIREVLSDERGYRYLNQLKIVYETSQRFQRQTERIYLNNALQITWAKLSSYTKYLPSEDLLESDIYAENDIDASLCKLCETKCDMNYVRYAGNHYHVTCINLFLHFVEDSEISAMLNL